MKPEYPEKTTDIPQVTESKRERQCNGQKKTEKRTNKGTKEQTTIYKTLHRTLKIHQQEPHRNRG
jgi:hypothetical protein